MSYRHIYRCQSCEERFGTRIQLESHHLDKHQFRTMYQSNGMNPTDHLPFSTDLQQKKFPCETCGQAFSRSLTLKRHVQKEHGMEVEQPNSSGGSVGATYDPRGQTLNFRINLEDVQFEGSSESRSPRRSGSGAQFPSSGEAPSGDPTTRRDDMPDKEEQNGGNDQDVWAASSRDRVPAAISIIVLSSDEEDDPDEQKKPEVNLVGDQNQDPFLENEYRLMNLFFENEYRNMNAN